MPACKNDDSASNGSGLRGLSTAASLIPWAIVAVAIASALRATSRGLDLTDESLYIVLAVDPDLYLDMRLHAHLFWGVALDLVQTVRNLRVLNIVLLLASHMAFALSFWRCLPSLGLSQPEKRVRLAGSAAILSCALLTFAWLPQTPSYNNLAVTVVVTLVAISLELRSTPPGRWRTFLLIATGVLLWVLAIGRIGSLVAVPVIAALALPLERRAVRDWLNDAKRLVIGLVAASLFTHLLLASLQSIAAGLQTEVDATYGFWTLLGSYRGELWEMTTWIFDPFWPMIVGAFIAGVFGTRSRTRLLGIGLMVAITVRTTVLIDSAGWVAGGSENAAWAQLVLPTLLLVIVAFAVGTHLSRGFGPPKSTRPLVPLFLLTTIPFLAAAGTNNRIGTVALFFGVFWTASLMAVLTATVPQGGRIILQTMAVAITLLSLSMSHNGLWNRPYRQAPLATQQVLIDEAGPLRGLKVDTAVARLATELSQLRDSLESTSRPYVIALNRAPGLVLLSEGQTPGSPWLHMGIPMTVKDAIRIACGDVDRPVILFDDQESPPELVLEALETDCLDRNWRPEGQLQIPDGRTFNVLATG